MNTRERYLETVLFGKPDRIPFQPGGPRESTLAHWHATGLAKNVDWFDELCRRIDIQIEKPKVSVYLGVNTTMIPEFEQKILERKKGSIVVQDWKGNICEISDTYDSAYCGGKGGKIDFVTRKWIKCPVENWADWEQMKTRYNPDDPARFPSDFDERCLKAKNRDSVMGIGVSGVFWQLREWLGFEGLCMALLEEPELVRDMVKFWDNFISAMLDKILQKTIPDYLHVSEDMAYKEKAMISPAMTREFILPTWTHWGDIIHRAGCPVYDVDSDGYVGELIPLWIEAGFQVNDPIEVAAGNDLPAFRQTYGTRIAYAGGIDKRAIARGGDVIRNEMDRLMPVIRVGGYLPSCDHGIPPDVSWPNMVDYGRLLAKATGWL